MSTGKSDAMPCARCRFLPPNLACDVICMSRVLKHDPSRSILQALVLGGAAEFPGFMALLIGARDALADALGDLRSVLVKEACTAVCTLAQWLGNAFAPVALHLIPVILKQIPVTIQVAFDSHACCAARFLSIARHALIGALLGR